MKNQTMLAIALGVTTSLSVVATAAAQTTTPASETTPHEATVARESYTLDGRAVDVRPAAKGVVCNVDATNSGVEQCFSSQAASDRAQIAALEAGTVPPGFGALPDAATRKSIISRLRAGNETKDVGSGTSKAAAAACRTNTHIYEDLQYNGISGQMGFTGGQTYWRNYSSVWNDRVTSFKPSGEWYTYWRRDADGQGPAYSWGWCTNQPLITGTYTDGTARNDSFTSWKVYL
jgi:hypothetical protein